MSTSNLPKGCDTSMWFHQCLHQKGKECVCDLVHARLICSHSTSVHDHLITISSCLQQFLLTSIQLRLTLSFPLHPFLLHPHLALSHTHVPVHMYMVCYMSPDYSPIQRSVAPRPLLFMLAYRCVFTPFTVMLSALDILHRWVGHRGSNTTCSNT